jgi:hypothetical protein
VNNLSVNISHLTTHSRDMSNVLCGSWHVISRHSRTEHPNDTATTLSCVRRPLAPSSRSSVSSKCHAEDPFEHRFVAIHVHVDW